MLSELHIEHLGVIEHLDLVLGPGLTAVTGETGAGKTMLIEAIELLVGGRADAAYVRPGANEARVEGRFVVGDDEFVLARAIPVEGRSRAYVNGRLATVANLAETGARLVDLHGQHSHQGLLVASAQRAALDRYARTDLSGLRAARARLTEIDAALAALGGDARTRARELDLLRFQAAEIAAAGLVDDAEDERLAAEEELLSGAQAHREAALRAVEALAGEPGAVDGLGAALAALANRAPFSEASARLRSLGAELADVADTLRDQAERIDDDPERLAEVVARRQRLRDLCRKYGDTLADVRAYEAEVLARLTELEGFAERVEQLGRDRVAAQRDERAEAAAVGRARRGAAGALADAVATRLQTLAMPRARVEVMVGDEDPGDQVEFHLGANPGEPLLPLARVASGGELARTMLALRLVLTEAPESLVFDEVDAGIGGSAASAVANALAELGRRHQVLVVTHLAQVAARATSHVVVSKAVVDGRTVARAERVEGPARVDEVARMLSGDPPSTQARQHAQALLEPESSRRTNRA